MPFMKTRSNIWVFLKNLVQESSTELSQTRWKNKKRPIQHPPIADLGPWWKSWEISSNEWSVRKPWLWWLLNKTRLIDFFVTRNIKVRWFYVTFPEIVLVSAFFGECSNPWVEVRWHIKTDAVVMWRSIIFEGKIPVGKMDVAVSPPSWTTKIFWLNNQSLLTSV